MTDAVAKRIPEFGLVWREQLRIVGLSIRRETLLAALALGLLCLFGVVMSRVPTLSAVIDGELADFRLNPSEPGLGIVSFFTALVLSFLIWRGERPWGDTPIWSLPVDHRRHSLTKVAAGWVWLMIVLGAALSCVVLATVAGGGTIGVDEVRQLVIDDAGFVAGEAGATRGVPWTTQWWEWVLPFTSATAAYLFASALLLATPHPYRWGVGLYAVMVVLMGVVELAQVESLFRAGESFAWFIGGEDFSWAVRLPTGERAEGWARLPSMGMWAAWAASAISLGVACVVTASARVRDH